MGFLSYHALLLARLPLKRGLMFYRHMSELARFRALPPDQQRLRQLELLDSILRFAARTNFYQPLCDQHHSDDAIELLKSFPYLEKETVRARPDDFATYAFPTIPAHTSGTTGTPLRLRRALGSIAREEAGFITWYRSAGWPPEDTMIVMRGDLVAPVERRQPPYGLRDLIGNRLVLSTYHLSDAAMSWYLAAIQSSGARFLSAYPSAAFILADYLSRNELAPLGLRAVFLASETVQDGQKSVIEKFLGPVHAHYGSAERVCWMTTCSAGHYHEDTSYGFSEFAPLGEGMFEIIATGLTNNAMPLIRYRTGDIAVAPFTWDQFCPCGKPGPGCKQIVGRVDDLLVTPDHRRIGRLDHVFKGVAHVVAAQIIQHAPDRVEMRVIRADGYSAEDEAGIARNFAARVGPDVRLEFTYLVQMPRTAAGKFRAVVSRLPAQP